jgi:hypothetical protein
MTNATSNVTAITDKQTTPATKFTIQATLDGFPVVLGGEGRAGDLRIIIDPLKAIGAEPPLREMNLWHIRNRINLMQFTAPMRSVCAALNASGNGQRVSFPTASARTAVSRRTTKLASAAWSEIALLIADMRFPTPIPDCDGGAPDVHDLFAPFR